MKKANIDIPVISAYDGQEALKILEDQQQDIELILLDLNMPGMNGFVLLEKVCGSETLKDVRVVILSSSLNQRHLEVIYSSVYH